MAMVKGRGSRRPSEGVRIHPHRPDPVHLTQRELTVFRAIIHHYVQTAEPVGSRAIARKYRLGISPATIRNVMIDLEEQGLVSQPHASAGRVPTDTGYRVYVNEVMRPESLTRDEVATIDDAFKGAPAELPGVLELASAVLGTLSAQLAVALHPPVRLERVEKLHVIRLDPARWLMAVMGANGAVRTAVISLGPGETGEEWERVVEFLREALTGTEWDDSIGASIKERVFRMGLGENAFGRAALRAVENLCPVDEVDQIHFGGTGNIMIQPEFKDSDKLRGLFEALEARAPLVRILELDRQGDPEGVLVAIGEEIPLEGMRALSVVSSSYRVGDSRGRLGVIGPTRMRYPRLISLVTYIASVVSGRLELS